MKKNPDAYPPVFVQKKGKTWDQPPQTGEEWRQHHEQWATPTLEEYFKGLIRSAKAFIRRDLGNPQGRVEIRPEALSDRGKHALELIGDCQRVLIGLKENNAAWAVFWVVQAMQRVRDFKLFEYEPLIAYGRFRDRQDHADRPKPEDEEIRKAVEQARAEGATVITSRAVEIWRNLPKSENPARKDIVKVRRLMKKDEQKTVSS